MIVLHEIEIKTVTAPDNPVVAFKKETAAVFERFWFYDQHTIHFGGLDADIHLCLLSVGRRC